MVIILRKVSSGKDRSYKDLSVIQNEERNEIINESKDAINSGVKERHRSEQEKRDREYEKE